MKFHQREFLSGKIGDVGNFAIATLVFGQFLSKEPFALPVFFSGILFWAICYLAGFFILKGGE